MKNLEIEILKSMIKGRLKQLAVNEKTGGQSKEYYQVRRAALEDVLYDITQIIE